MTKWMELLIFTADTRFDKLTMIGETPFALSLWFEKLTTFVRSS